MKTSKDVPKMSTMITSAIRHLRQSQGSTPKEIMNYIISRYNLESPKQRQMKTALKRGLDCGILDRNRGHYKLNAIAEYILQMGRETEKKVQIGTKKQRRSVKGKKRRDQTVKRSKGRSSIRSTIEPSEERCSCITTKPKNAYTLESDIPLEQQGQCQKDVVCCFKKKWKEKCDNESTDQSRSTIGSNPEITDDQEKKRAKPSWSSPVAFRGALARLSGANEGRGPGEGSLNKTNDHNSSSREVKAGTDFPNTKRVKRITRKRKEEGDFTVVQGRGQARGVNDEVSSSKWLRVQAERTWRKTTTIGSFLDDRDVMKGDCESPPSPVNKTGPHETDFNSERSG
ncbi:hypothetical protein HZH68_002365 [Vespula germanica]|uniref:H15 domain-containing protein n=1 Tax=Vespula germanica TaxID=30212 RepID=A0A834KXX2_VESGE|nr:hypothetical protein HZH68_002365 [Vespula germanica]